MKYTLDWLTDPEVFAVNRIAAISLKLPAADFPAKLAGATLR